MFWVNKHTACRGENTKPALRKQKKKMGLRSSFFFVYYVVKLTGYAMSNILLAIIQIVKMLYPFIRESIFGQDSVLTLLRRRKVFIFILIGNFILFLIAAFLTEQNFILLDRLKEKKAEIVALKESNNELTIKNSRLLGILKGDLDEVCYAHIFQGKLDLVPEEIRNKITDSSYTQPALPVTKEAEPVDQNNSTQE